MSVPSPQAHAIFVLPVSASFLLYSPLHDFAALVNRAAALQLRDVLRGARDADDDALRQILQVFQSETQIPARAQGMFLPPFLGLVPTRTCDLSCRYCGFWDTENSGVRMSLKLTRDAVDWYIDLAHHLGKQQVEIHFFGGEPFSAEDVVDFAVYYARTRARALGITPGFEAATNGTFNETRCQWIADYFDTVVLSLDGPAEIHDRHRPRHNGQGSFERVARNAEILSAGSAALCLRTCITSDSVSRMEEMAAWFCETFRPQSVCFETLQPTSRSDALGLYPPDPWQFARHYIYAARILESYGVEPVYATADIRSKHVTFCPVGRDVAIVSPDGAITACYLLRHDWESKGLNLHLGRIDSAGVVRLDPTTVESIRNMTVLNLPFCARCFCRWHCAGGCHVNHAPRGKSGDFDRLCLQTRVIALRNILLSMGQENLMDALLEKPAVLEAAIRRPSDALLDMENDCA